MPVVGSKKCKQCPKWFVGGCDKRRKFCSLQCCWQWRKDNKDQLKGAFKVGEIPWNMGTVGVMKANSGTFKKGRANENKQEIGAVMLRNDKHGGKRAWVKILDNGDSYDWKLRAVKVWEDSNGPIPNGYVVHHKDRNKLNDVVSNLELLTRAEHINEHRHEYEEKRKDAASEAKKSRRNRRATVR